MSKPHLTLSELGLDSSFLSELIIKHLFTNGVMSQRELVDNLAIAWNIIENLLIKQKREALVEGLSSTDGSSNIRFKLTDLGRITGSELIKRSGYIGRAPVPLESYTKVVKEQSIHNAIVTKETVAKAFEGVTVSQKILNRVGPALNSGRAIFIYGPSGTGKTFITKQLSKLLGDAVLIPYAISVGNSVIQMYDPVVHRAIKDKFTHDPRYILCHRPTIITGGELTMNMLEIQYDPNHRIYRAPLQLKATNGIYIIDDLGRQKVPTNEILNRWIIPMEERIDYLTFGNGQRIPVLFDVALIFSTNMNPNDLADEAFLRRLGYKIKFEYAKIQEYIDIWMKLSEEQGIPYNEKLLRKLLSDFYLERDIPLLPCHPRDLLGLITDICRFQNVPVQVNRDTWNFAIENYFVNFDE